MQKIFITTFLLRNSYKIIYIHIVDNSTNDISQSLVRYTLRIRKNFVW